MVTVGFQLINKLPSVLALLQVEHLPKRKDFLFRVVRLLLLLVKLDKQVNHLLKPISSEHPLQPLCVSWGKFDVPVFHDLLKRRRLAGSVFLQLQYLLQADPSALCVSFDVKQDAAAIDFPDNFDELSFKEGVQVDILPTYP